MQRGGWLGRWFSPGGLIPADQRRGELPAGMAAYRETLRVALPAVAEMACISLIGAADAMMVGNFLGPEALAAVGLTQQPRMLLLCPFFALNTAVTAVVARREGEGRREQAAATLRTALVLALLLSVMLMTLAAVFAVPLLRLAGGEGAEGDQVFSDAVAYFRITAFALPANALSMCICAAQRGVGKTRVTFWVNAGGNALNVLLNYCLIGGRLGFPRLAVRGAAAASAAGMGAAFFLSLLTLGGKHGNPLRLSLRPFFHPDRDSLAALSKVGGSAALEQAGLRLGYFISARALFSLGTAMFAANQICMQLTGLTFTLGDGLGVAATALVGQSLGKGRADLALLYGKICQRCAVIGSLALGALILLFRRDLAGWFVGAGTENAALAAAWAAQTMLALAAVQPFQTTAVTLSGCLRGAGDNRFVAVTAALCVSALRPVMTFIAVKALGLRLPGVWLLASLEIVLRALIFYPRFSFGRWKDKKI